MATSGSVNFTLTRDELIRSAFEDIGVAIEGEDLQPEEIKVGAVALNVMIKSWQGYGLNLWKRERVSIPLVSGQSTYTMGQKIYSSPTDILEVTQINDTGANFVKDNVQPGDYATCIETGLSSLIVNVFSPTRLIIISSIFTSVDQHYTVSSADIDTPRPLRILECDRITIADNTSTRLNPLSLQEYEALPNKAQEGVPINYFYDPTITLGSLSLWLVPGAVEASRYTIDIVYSAPIEDMDDSIDDFEFPQEWLEALQLGLAYRLSGKYALSYRERTLLRKDAKEALELVQSFDIEPTSLFFQPDNVRAR